jgi:hypothetical protein
MKQLSFDTQVTLQMYNLEFKEIEKPTTYKAIGYLFQNDVRCILIFSESFYVYSSDISINEKLIKAIQDIQKIYGDK